MIVSFMTEQGGVGKTSLCFNLAWYLSNKRKKILMVDLDGQGGSLTFFSGVPDRLEKYGIIDLFKKTPRVTKDNIVYPVKKNLDIIPSNEFVGELPEYIKASGDYECLKKILKKYENDYDYVFVDTNPTPSLIHITSLIASDGFIVPLLPDAKSIEGTKHVIDTFDLIKKEYNPELKMLGLVFNKYEGKTRLSRAVQGAIENYSSEHKLKITKNKIVKDIKIGEAVFYSTGITDYAAKSKGAESYRNLAKELFKIG